jgi:hypothetical protein
LGPEKRSSARKEFHETVRIHELNGSGEKNPGEVKNEPLRLTGVNISREGICLQTEYFFIPDHLFQLDFNVTGRDIHTLARVVWSEKNACGLQFLKPDDVACLFHEEPDNIRLA